MRSGRASHRLAGLDGEHPHATVSQQARRDAGAGPDVGDHQTIGRAEPREDHLNRPGGIRRPVLDVIRSRVR